MKAATASETGLVRERNEDDLLDGSDRGVFVVADGLGGHAAGDVASHLAVERLDRELSADHVAAAADLPRLLADALHAAHDEVYRASTADPAREGMGTTAVVAHVTDAGRLTLAHIGDSRAYLLHDGVLNQLTVDHVWQGQFGRALTQALGTTGGVEPDVTSIELTIGDQLLLCTDGLTDMVSDEAIEAVLNASASVDAARDTLVARALDAGGQDNITLVLIALD